MSKFPWVFVMQKLELVLSLIIVGIVEPCLLGPIWATVHLCSKNRSFFWLDPEISVNGLFEAESQTMQSTKIKANAYSICLLYPLSFHDTWSNLLRECQQKQLNEWPHSQSKFYSDCVKLPFFSETVAFSVLFTMELIVATYWAISWKQSICGKFSWNLKKA